MPFIITAVVTTNAGATGEPPVKRLKQSKELSEGSI